MTIMNKPERLSWMVPYLSVKDVKCSVDFYTKNFGFKLISHINEPSGIMVHAELKYKDISMMCGLDNIDGLCGQPPNSMHTTSPICFYLYTDNVDEFYQNANKAGAKKNMDLTKTPWNDKICGFIDLDGYSWIFATYVG